MIELQSHHSGIKRAVDAPGWPKRSPRLEWQIILDTLDIPTEREKITLGRWRTNRRREEC